MNKDVVVIGGGFFGMYIAEYCALKGCNVTLVEKEKDFMQRASYTNQARVHNGYHYPRSILTALRSRESFPRFANEFSDSIDSSFEKYYMIGKLLTKITATQFEKFCQRIGASYELVSNNISRLVNPNLIEAVFKTTEFAFDSTKLKSLMKSRLEAAHVRCLTGWEVSSIRQSDNDKLLINIENFSSDNEILEADHVFNATYSQLNKLIESAGVALIPLKHELAEMCLLQMPDTLKNVGITVMCGPFFSTMPFPARGLHSFSHVRYTPHFSWQENMIRKEVVLNNTKISAWGAMQRDAQRYIPLLKECKYEESLWEVKTVLPRSEINDSRPILFSINHGLRGFHCVMGGKIDNVYDVVDAIENNNLLG